MRDSADNNFGDGVTRKSAVVVARYAENLDWLKELLAPGVDVFVYNKGPNPTGLEEMCHVETLGNVGRESHTYLYFLANHHHELGRWKQVLFFQGNPFDCLGYTIGDVQGLILGEHSKAVPLGSYSEHLSPETSLACEAHPNGLPVFEYINHWFITTVNEPVLANYGAQWLVPVTVLHWRSREFYRMLLKVVGRCNNPMEGFVLERIWSVVFSRDIMDWVSHYDVWRENFARGDWGGSAIE